ncbi:hypothetical protein ES703_102686 [subsurface metagenome]
MSGDQLEELVGQAGYNGDEHDSGKKAHNQRGPPHQRADEHKDHQHHQKEPRSAARVCSRVAGHARWFQRRAVLIGVDCLVLGPVVGKDPAHIRDEADACDVGHKEKQSEAAFGHVAQNRRCDVLIQ